MQIIKVKKNGKKFNNVVCGKILQKKNENLTYIFLCMYAYKQINQNIHPQKNKNSIP